MRHDELDAFGRASAGGVDWIVAALERARVEVVLGSAHAGLGGAGRLGKAWRVEACDAGCAAVGEVWSFRLIFVGRVAMELDQVAMGLGLDTAMI